MCDICARVYGVAKVHLVYLPEVQITAGIMFIVMLESSRRWWLSSFGDRQNSIFIKLSHCVNQGQTLIFLEFLPLGATSRIYTGSRD